jgi:serine/threonine-protein kinase
MISHLGRYEIIEELGRGEMGIVYKAHDPLIDRFVAIKAINLQGLNEDEREEYATRFYQEAKAAGRLNHPNIFTIHDLGETGDVAYIAMELMEEPDLQSIIASNVRLSIDDALDIAFQVAVALAYANQHGVVVHRDIKPSNIMVLRDKHVKIADFGIAKMSSSLLHTKTGRIVGTPLYMSPEQVQSHTIDSRSDIFALGIVLYQMLTWKHPFNGENSNSIMYQIVNEEPQKPSLLNPAIPEMLDTIVSKCLAKKPDDRYQSAGELAGDLHSCRSQLPHTNDGIDRRRGFLAGDAVIHGKKIGKWKLLRIIVLIALLSVGLFELIEQLIEHYLL